MSAVKEKVGDSSEKKVILWTTVVLFGAAGSLVVYFFATEQQPLLSDITFQDKTSHTTLNIESSDPALQTEHFNYHNLIRTNLINSLTYLFC